MKKSYLKRLICLVLSGLVLCSALAMAAVNGSPYEVLKRSLFDIEKMDNMTMRTEIKGYLDGAEKYTETVVNFVSKDSTLSYTDDLNRFSYYSDDYTVNGVNYYTNNESELWYSAQSPGYTRNVVSYLNFNSDAQQRFVEMLVDLFVGDLKNNISMSQDGDMRYITGTLTESQIPELYNAALEIFATEATTSHRIITHNEVDSMDYAEGTCILKYAYLEGSQVITEYTKCSNIYEVTDLYNRGYAFEYGNKYYDYDNSTHLRTDTRPATREDFASDNDDLFNVPLSRARFSYVHGSAKVDSEGRLNGLSATVTLDATDIFGDRNEMELKIELEFSDIGTTQPTCPIDGVQELLAEYYNTRSEQSYIRFKLNSDGTIDKSSVFDNFSDMNDATFNPASEDLKTDNIDDTDTDNDDSDVGDAETT